MADLAGVDLKIERANAHLSDLSEQIGRRFKPDRYRTVREYDAETSHHIYRAFDIPEIDASWSLIVGEFLYNLRSALDHLAWQLVLLDGGQPGEHTQFPINETPLNREGNPRSCQINPEIRRSDILDALKASQPYCRIDGSHDATQVKWNPLWQLWKLNNIDKHRLLLVLVSSLKVDDLWWASDFGDPTPTAIPIVGPVQEGDPVARFDFHGAEPSDNFHPNISLHVTLNEPALPPDTGLVSLVNLLWAYMHHVQWAILDYRFRPLFT